MLYEKEATKEDRRECLKLYYRNEYGSEYEISKTAEPFPDFGEDTMMMFAQVINLFLKHIGFLAFDKDYVVLESVTQEEYDAIVDYLYELRKDDD